MPYRPIGPWIEGCVPDSIRYVPGAGAVQTSAVAPAPGCTSVANDCTRGFCGGGVKPAGGLSTVAVDQVICDCVLCGGLAAVVGEPRPPPSWPMIVIDVGMLFGVVAPEGVNDRLLVRLMVSDWPVATVMTTGDQVPAAAVPAATAGLSALHAPAVPPAVQL